MLWGERSSEVPVAGIQRMYSSTIAALAEAASHELS